MSAESLLRPGDIDILDDLEFCGGERSGRVLSVKGTLVRTSLPDVRVGEMVRIRREVGDLEGEVIGFDQGGAIVMPFGRVGSVAADAVVVPAESRPMAPCGAAVRGRVLDALGRDYRTREPIVDADRTPLHAAPPSAIDRRLIDEPISTGVRALDAFLTIGRGQRVAIAAAAGVGKSTLLGALVKNVEADSIVIALVGERGNEPRDFLEKHLDEEARERATIVVSTSDESPLMRLRAAYVATAIAEAARARGEHVVLLMDSVTRFARALRDVGQALGEPLGPGGIPASTAQILAQLVERAGNDAHGTMTAFYTLLAESDEMDDPIVQETISLLDGHIVLSRDIQKRKRFPAIDVLASVSRRMGDVTAREHRDLAARVAEVEAAYWRDHLLIKTGDYEGEKSASEMQECHQALEGFLRQDFSAEGAPPLEASIAALEERFGAW